MLYEKTLSRKIISLQQKPRDENSNPVPNGSQEGLDKVKSSRKSVRRTFYEFVRAPWKSWKRVSSDLNTSEEVKQPASMGKILNLMRYCSHLYNA